MQEQKQEGVKILPQEYYIDMATLLTETNEFVVQAQKDVSYVDCCLKALKKQMLPIITGVNLFSVKS